MEGSTLRLTTIAWLVAAGTLSSCDYVLGVLRDEHDVERVMLHALDRGP